MLAWPHQGGQSYGGTEGMMVKMTSLGRPCEDDLVGCSGYDCICS